MNKIVLVITAILLWAFGSSMIDKIEFGYDEDSGYEELFNRGRGARFSGGNNHGSGRETSYDNISRYYYDRDDADWNTLESRRRMRRSNGQYAPGHPRSN